MSNINLDLALDICKESAKRGYKIASSQGKNLSQALNYAEEKVQRTIIDFNSSQYYAPETAGLLERQLIDIRNAFNNISFALKDDLQGLRDNLTEFSITLFGRTMAGKSTLMEILTNGNGDSIGKGSQRTTRDIRKYSWNGLSITDVPGIGAFDGEDDEQIAFDAAKSADLILFLITDDAPQEVEAECFSQLVNLGKPMICIMNVKASVNKDTNIKLAKMELYIREFLNNCHIDLYEVNAANFYYSLTKYMLIYGTDSLIEKLYSAKTVDDMDEFICNLVDELRIIIEKTKDIPRKSRERVAFAQLYKIFNRVNANNAIKNNYPFEYRIVYDGLINLLTEKRINIKTTHLIIDEEKNVLAASNGYSFEKVECIKSNQMAELRMADWIVTFVGRMIRALTHDCCMNEHISSLSELDNDNIREKHLLSSEWFDIEEKHLHLYHAIYQVFIGDRCGEYWATMSTYYLDSVEIFYCLLKYFHSYKDFEDFSCIDISMHSERFNSFVVSNLERRYSA